MAIRARQHSIRRKGHFPPPPPREPAPAHSLLRLKNVFQAFQNCVSLAGRPRAALQSERVTVLGVTLLL